MRKLVWAVTLGVVVLALGLVGYAGFKKGKLGLEASSIQYVKNPSFEIANIGVNPQDAKDWTVDTTIAKRVKATTGYGGSAYDGKYLISVNKPPIISKKELIPLKQTIFNVPAGQNYILTGYYRGNVTGSTGYSGIGKYVKMQVVITYSNGKTLNRETGLVIYDTTKWNQNSLSISIPSGSGYGTNNTVKVEVRPLVETSDAYFVGSIDKVTLTTSGSGY